MSDEKEKRMAENYKITHGIPIGDKEVVLGVDEKAEMPYLCAFIRAMSFSAHTRTAWWRMTMWRLWRCLRSV